MHPDLGRDLTSRHLLLLRAFSSVNLPLYYRSYASSGAFSFLPSTNLKETRSHLPPYQDLNSALAGWNRLKMPCFQLSFYCFKVRFSIVLEYSNNLRRGISG